MKKDLDRLQGIWSIAEMEMEGQTMSDAMLSNARVMITGNRFSSTGMGSVYEGAFTLHETAKPRQFDITFDAGPEKGNTNLGIYEIKGDTWKLCLATRGDVRPSEFAGTPGTGFVFETLTRSKSVAAKIKAPAARPAAVPAATAVTEFEGEWQMVSAIMDGQPMEQSAVAWVKRVTHGNETTVIAGPQVVMKMQFTADGSQSPKIIDYVQTAGPNKGKPQHGIYEFNDGLLKICVSPPGAPRPVDFQSVRGDGRTFTIWKPI